MRQSRLPLLPLLLALTACNSKTFEQAIAPDPRLTGSPSPSSTPNPSPDTGVGGSPASAERPLAPTIAAIPPSPSPTPPPGLGGYTDLDTTPPELRRYLDPLLKLALLPLTPCNPSPCTTFQPNQPIQRREYARWLVTINNRFYQDTQPKQIRLATTSAASLFTDLPNTDPDFAAIQGLAEAGLIPSALGRDNAPKAFKPNAPLTREDLIAWKIPIDLRRLPSPATIDQIKQNIGFQDTQKLSPAVLGAILADHKNGDNANFRRAFGYTTIFQPQRPVTRAEAAAALWNFGTEATAVSADKLLNPTPTPTPPASPSPTPTPSPQSPTGST